MIFLESFDNFGKVFYRGQTTETKKGEIVWYTSKNLTLRCIRI
jgi:hypothetical protein